MSSRRWIIGLSLFGAMMSGLSGCSDDSGPGTTVDSRRVAFVSDEGGDQDIWEMRVDGGDLRNLTSSPGIDDQPAWSPNGARIAFVSKRTGSYELFVMDSDGTNQIQLTNRQRGVARPTWSPDGGRILFSSDGILYSLAPDGSDTTSICCVAGGLEPAWNPHNNRVAVSHFSSMIALLDTDATHESSVTLGHQGAYTGQPSWNPTGNRLVFYQFLGGKYTLVVSDTLRSPGYNLTAQVDSTQARGVIQPAWSPDGGDIAFTCNTSQDPALGQYDLCLIHIDGTGFRQITHTTSQESWPAWAP